VQRDKGVTFGATIIWSWSHVLDSSQSIPIQGIQQLNLHEIIEIMHQ